MFAHVQVEVYLLALTVGLDSAEKPPQTLSISKEATLADLKARVCAAFGIADPTKTRLWNYYMPSMPELLQDEARMLSSAGLNGYQKVSIVAVFLAPSKHMWCRVRDPSFLPL